MTSGSVGCWMVSLPNKLTPSPAMRPRIRQRKPIRGVSSARSGCSPRGLLNSWLSASVRPSMAPRSPNHGRMAMAETGSRNDPVLGFLFKITFNNQSVGGFSECSGLQLETEIQDYAEGGLNTHMHKF